MTEKITKNRSQNSGTQGEIRDQDLSNLEHDCGDVQCRIAV
jgi:hypothetical protein